MLYIRKFYVVKNICISIYIHRWDRGTQLQWRVTDMTQKKLKKEKNIKRKKLKKGENKKGKILKRDKS